MKYLFIFFLSFPALAQETFYDWEKSPQPFKDTVIQNEDAVILKQFNDVRVSGNINAWNCNIITHTKTLVLTEIGIEKTNKFYYYIDRSKTLKEIKARVITPSGKIINVPDDHIINSNDEKERTQYKYFAYEGVEKGSILEVLVVENYNVDRTFAIIEDFFASNAEFNIFDFETRFTRDQGTFLFNYELTINKHLYQINTLQEDQISQTTIKAKNLPKYKEEPYSYRTDYEGYLYYQLGYSNHLEMAQLNNFKGKRFQFSSITNQFINEKRLFSHLNQTLETAGLSEMESLYAIEDYIKGDGMTVETNNINVTRLGQPNYTEDQQLKLIYQYAKLFQLEPTIILTTDINRLKISPEVNAPFLYTDLFILFPKTQEVYSPSKYSRIHPITQEYLGNHYLNTDDNQQYEFTPSSAEFSVDSVVVTLNPSFTELVDSISIYRETSGHFCRNFLSEDEASSPEAKTSALHYFTHYHLPESTIYDSIIENHDFTNYMRKPLIGKFRAISTSDITEVDGTYILAIGKYIGDQISLHNENAYQRITPIRIGNPHIYKRQIKIEIPENYEIKNLDELIMNTSTAARELGLGFESNYSIEGNMLTISIKEWYNRATYQAQFYRCFLEVMNAAADFNNMQLVFERK
jgi:hypothetical protein